MTTKKRVPMIYFVALLRFVILVLHAILFAGIMIQGAFSFGNSYFVFDRFFSLGMVLIGLIFLIITIQLMMKPMKGGNSLLAKIKQQKLIIMITAGLFILLFLLQPIAHYRLLYAGAIAGDFVIKNARLGFLRFTPVDLYDLGFATIAWLGQWYLLYIFVAWISGVVRKFKKINYEQEDQTMSKKDFFSAELLAGLQTRSALKSAYLAQDRSADVGFDFSNIDLVMDKVEEENREIREAFNNRKEDREHFLEELGDGFFALVNLCRHAGVDPEEVLIENVAKYLRRCERIEETLKQEGATWSDLDVVEINRRWKQVKKSEL